MRCEVSALKTLGEGVITTFLLRLTSMGFNIIPWAMDQPPTSNNEFSCSLCLQDLGHDFAVMLNSFSVFYLNLITSKYGMNFALGNNAEHHNYFFNQHVIAFLLQLSLFDHLGISWDIPNPVSCCPDCWKPECHHFSGQSCTSSILTRTSRVSRRRMRCRPKRIQHNSDANHEPKRFKQNVVLTDDCAQHVQDVSCYQFQGLSIQSQSVSSLPHESALSL